MGRMGGGTICKIDGVLRYCAPNRTSNGWAGLMSLRIPLNDKTSAKWCNRIVASFMIKVETAIKPALNSPGYNMVDFQSLGGGRSVSHVPLSP